MRQRWLTLIELEMSRGDWLRGPSELSFDTILSRLEHAYNNGAGIVNIITNNGKTIMIAARTINGAWAFSDTPDDINTISNSITNNQTVTSELV